MWKWLLGIGVGAAWLFWPEKGTAAAAGCPSEAVLAKLLAAARGRLSVGIDRIECYRGADGGPVVALHVDACPTGGEVEVLGADWEDLWPQGSNLACQSKAVTGAVLVFT